jgi:hypothetical protein
MTDSSRLDALPRGPRELPALQTAHWLMRPLGFLESCRRRFGDTFTVRFAGHRTPLVIISDPAAIRALYSERENRLTRGARSPWGRCSEAAQFCFKRARSTSSDDG